MIYKKFSIFIISFFVFMNAAYTPAALNSLAGALSEVPAVNKVLAAQNDGMEVVSYSSFMQISKQHMAEICSRLYESLQTNLVFFSSASESVIKELSRTAVIASEFCDVLFVKAQNIEFAGKIYAYSQNTLKDSNNVNMMFLFILLQLIMLLLYALYKGSIPHASINYNKINKTRYQY